MSSYGCLEENVLSPLLSLERLSHNALENGRRKSGYGCSLSG